MREWMDVWSGGNVALHEEHNRFNLNVARGLEERRKARAANRRPTGTQQENRLMPGAIPSVSIV